MANAEQYMESLVKSIGKQDVVLPTTVQMAQEVGMAELDTSAKEKRFGISRVTHYVPEEIMEVRLSEDKDYRAAKQDPITQEQMRRDVEFREKEATYKKKDSDQEDAAMARYRQQGQNATRDWELDPDNLRVELESAKAMIKQLKGSGDLLKEGVLQYEKEYVEILKELSGRVEKYNKKNVRTRRPDKPLVLAQEKYLFYKKFKNELIGKKQFEIVEKQTQAAELHRNESFYDNEGLIELVASNRARLQDKKGKDNADGVIVKKALAMYRMLEKEIDRTEKGSLDIINDTIFLIKDRNIPETSAHQLKAYKSVLDRDNANRRFCRNACRACIEYLLLEPHQREAYASDITPYAGYIRKQFGVDVGGFDMNTTLRNQSVAKRIGADIRTRHTGLYDVDLPSGVSQELSEAETGYEYQEIYERNINPALVQNDTIVKQTLAVMRAQYQKYPKMAEELENATYRNMAFLVTMLPSSKFRDSSGKESMFKFSEENKKNPYMASYVRDLLIVRDAQEDRELREECLQELINLIDIAYEDVTEFATTGDSKMILKAVTDPKIMETDGYRAVFGYTAGMPMLRDKARQIRDVLSMILSCGDLVGQGTTMFNNLREKWYYVSNVVDTIEYRERRMDCYYNNVPGAFDEVRRSLEAVQMEHTPAGNWDVKE